MHNLLLIRSNWTGSGFPTMHEELFAHASGLEAQANKIEAQLASEPLTRLWDVAEDLAKSWSGSPLGYHSLVYYRGFERPPAGARFSIEWGLMDSWPSEGTIGDWEQYDYDQVVQEIYRRAGNLDIAASEEVAKEAKLTFERAKADIISILATFLRESPDKYIDRLNTQAQKLEVTDQRKMLLAQMLSGQVMSRDTAALTAGMKPAPHQAVLARLALISAPGQVCKALASIARQAGSHMARVQKHQRRDALVGTNVFIGHGSSAAWRELKDFIDDRLHLPYDEFNRVPVAGVTNIARLSEMLDAAAIAFLVLTAEDEQIDGSYRARMNVIHEVGLFQGRLGFSKAIVVLEEGCDQFSNIEGLGQIRFPLDRISACFDEVRRVLEREELVQA